MNITLLFAVALVSYLLGGFCGSVMMWLMIAAKMRDEEGEP